MRLSAEDRRQHLLDAARDLFARQGFSGTTTREIAEKAGVNEALIFRHFPKKEDLYWFVIEEQCGSENRRLQLRFILENEEDDRIAFQDLAQSILQRQKKNTELTRLLLYSALEGHELSHRFFRTHISGIYEIIAERIRQRIEEGRFRKVDPLLAARSLLGMMIYHLWMQELFGGKKVREFAVGEVAETVTGIWLEGMAAKPADGGEKSLRSRTSLKPRKFPASNGNGKGDIRGVSASKPANNAHKQHGSKGNRHLEDGIKGR